MTAHTIMVGNTVWAPLGARGWRRAIVSGIGRMNYELTRIRLTFEDGSQGYRRVGHLKPRNPKLGGKDKPPRPPLPDSVYTDHEYLANHPELCGHIYDEVEWCSACKARRNQKETDE